LARTFLRSNTDPGLRDDGRGVGDGDIVCAEDRASVAPARTRDETTVVSSDSMMSPFTAAIVSGRATLAFVRVSHAVVVRAVPRISRSVVRTVELLCIGPGSSDVQ
jgi:hypothetical protein